MTTRWLTPICGAARPAPFWAAMVSFMSSTSSRSSGVAKRSTGFARSRSTGWPMRSTSRTGMAFHELRDDEAHLRHRFLDDAGDVVEGDAFGAVTPARGGIDHDRKRRVGHLQLAGECRLRHAGHADHRRAVALEPVDLG